MSSNHSYLRLRHLFTSVNKKRLFSKTIIYTPDVSANSIFLIEKGAVRIFNYIDGEKKTKAILFKNDFLGFEGFFKKTKYQNYAETLTEEVELIELTIDEFELGIKRDYNTCSELFEFLEQQKELWQNRFFTKSFTNREGLIIEYLEALALKIGRKVGFEILIPIMPTHQDIAGILCISRQTVSQTLSMLKKQNSIYYSRSRLIIRNEEGKIFI
jgi:CRP/FNR family cyclic AMP-dependent transcriptional regulator